MLLRASLRQQGSNFMTLAKHRAFEFGAACAGAKAIVADVLVQRVAEGRTDDQMDLKRIAVFGVFGTLYSGVWQFYLFNRIMPRLVPGTASFAAKPLRQKLADAAGMRGLALQVFIENGLNNALLYFPIFYSLQSMLQGCGMAHSLVEGPRTYAQNAHKDLPDIWKFWVPAQLVNFGFCPLWMRVPMTAALSFVWTAYISCSRGAYQQRLPAPSSAHAADMGSPRRNRPRFERAERMQLSC